MKKLLIIAALSITVAAVIKRVVDKSVKGYWSTGPHITLDTKKVEAESLMKLAANRKRNGVII